MGNECCKPNSHRSSRREEATQRGTELRNLPPARRVLQRRTGPQRNRREESTQQGTEPENLPPARRVLQKRTRPTQGESSFLGISAYPEQQTQTVGQQSNPREVAPTDFNNYMRVDRLQLEDPKPVKETHEAGHDFGVKFTVTNTTSDYLKFTDTPAVAWRERITKEVNIGGKTEKESQDIDQYAKEPGSKTFHLWRLGWKGIIEPNQEKTVYINDVPRLTDIDKGKDGQPRTVFRKVDFDVSVPGNGPTFRATQNIKVVDGKVEELDLKEK